ncbi:carboxypeptidase regulatory-like domain-containing protein [Micromonospora arborensis]|uniref:carboxypeptidase regulatory-like domain-containing protein n=1 Tax=Micromonospora arborensis TaxID=2116518 RepID=UPI0033E2A858
MNSRVLRALCAAAMAGLMAVIGLTGPAQAAEAAGLDGTITNKLTGEPVAGAGIVIQQQDGSNWNFTNSDTDGRFAFPDTPAGEYTVQVNANGYVEEYLYGHQNSWEADLITVPATLQIPLMPIHYGDVAGRVVDQKGAGIAHVGVQLRRGANWVADTVTNNQGRYRFERIETTSNYTAQFTFPSGQVLFNGGVESEYDAPPFTVTANKTTTVNLTRPPVGNLMVRAVDKKTGAAIAGYCWYPQDGPFSFRTTCTDKLGRARFQDMPVGTYRGGGYDPNKVYVNGLFGPVTVTENETTRATVKLEKSVSLHVDFVDAATGDPVNGACVTLADPVYTDVGQNGRCGSEVDYDNLFAEEHFRLFVAPYDEEHGAQWVSKTGGGTGDPAQAKVFKPVPGERIRVTVKLDGAGSVTGVVRDAATGTAVRDVCPTPTGPAFSYTEGPNANCTYDGGQYTIRNLGPYQWKLAFPAYDGQHAWAWSGNAVSRASATPVQVVADETVTLDAALPATGTISGTVTVPDGTCLTCVGITAVDATTGDWAGIQPSVRSDGTFTMKGLNTQDVRLLYSVGDGRVAYPNLIHTTAGEAVTGITITVPAA